jgi:hypothetical protein
VVSSRIRNVIADYNPVVGTQAIGLDPTITLVESGAALQVTSSVQSDGKTATLDLHSVLTEGEPLVERELRGAAGRARPRRKAIWAPVVRHSSIE